MAQPQPQKPLQPQRVGPPPVPAGQPKIVLPAASSAAPPALDAIAPAEPAAEPEREAQPEPKGTTAAHAMTVRGIMWVPDIGRTPGGYVFGEFQVEFDAALNPRLAESLIMHPSDRANACDRLRREIGKQIISSGSWRK